jgi:hypothetical protein
MIQATRTPWQALATLLLGIAIFTPSQAASVRLVGFDELVGSSELIFHGTVVASHSRRIAAAPGIVTEVEFEVLETYKGNAGADRVVLQFAGGVVDGRGVQIQGLTLPAAGERGVYFVEQTARPQIHPLYGWDQGHYRVEREAGGPPRVYTNRGLAVTAARSAPSPSDVRLSEGLPLGITASADAGPGSTLSLTEFAAAIRAVAERPAGASR